MGVPAIVPIGVGLLALGGISYFALSDADAAEPEPDEETARQRRVREAAEKKRRQKEASRTPSPTPPETEPVSLEDVDVTSPGQPTATTGEPRMSAELQETVARILDAGTPAQLEALATQLRALGLSSVADQLEQAAAEREAAEAEPVPDVSVPEPEPAPEPEPIDDIIEQGRDILDDVTSAPTPEPAPEPETSALALEGIELNEHLSTHSRYDEDRSLVEQWQAQAGLAEDGMYGPNTAKRLATVTGEVVAVPYYWPSDWQAAKADYIDWVEAKAAANPSQAAAWLAQIPAIERS